MPEPAQTPTPTTDGPTLAVETTIAPQNSPATAPAREVAPVPPVSADASPSPVEAGTAPSAEATKPEVTQPADVPTLLEEVSLEGKPKAEEPKVEPDKKPEEVKAEVKPEGEAPKVEEPKAEPPKLDPIDYFREEGGIKLPETLKMDDATKGDVVKAFDAFRADPNTGAQGLIDLHNKVLTDAMEQVRRNQYETFNTTRKNWAAEIAADPEMGGAGFETTKRAVARMRDMFVPEADRPAFDEFLRVTGAGDNPAFFRMLHRAARFFDEPRMPPPNPKPPANIGKRRASAADLYPNTNFK